MAVTAGYGGITTEMKIFLDDDPRRDSWVDDTWTIVRTPNEAAINLIEVESGGEPITLLSLDHDLGDDVPTGYDLMNMIEGWAAAGLWDRIPQKFEIHSANPVGRKNMLAAIASIERMRNV